MNYEKIYNKIIEKRKVEKLSKKEIYCESHHIIPVSFDKSLEKDENNIVNLTAREHYVCHKLLQKIALEKYGKNSHEYMAMTYCMFRMSNNKTYEIKILYTPHINGKIVWHADYEAFGSVMNYICQNCILVEKRYFF